MPSRPFLAVALALLALCAWKPARAVEAAMGRDRLEPAEALAHSLAVDLAQLAREVRRGDLGAVARHFAEGFTADGLPSTPGSLRRERGRIASHGWLRVGSPDAVVGGRGAGSETTLILRSVGEAEILERIAEILSHFSEVEDIRLDVIEAEFSGLQDAAGEAMLALALVGRDSEGRREWLRGRFEIAAHRETDSWRILRWHTASLDSLVSTEDLFSEVAGPAGIDRSFPVLGVPPNEGFAAHGGAVGDADGDGLMDLLFAEPDGARLYLNDGTGGFRDVSDSMLPRDLPRPTAAAFLDHDQDGDSDIFLSAVGPQMLLENGVDREGIRRFQDVSARAGVDAEAVGSSVAVTDVNGDGLPDIYVCSTNRFGSVLPGSWSRATNGTPNLLFINIGSGRFRELARDWGVADSRWSTAAAFADLNGDGWQDLYVANQFGENALYINKRTRFHDEAHLRGVKAPGGGTGAAWGDYDNDGDLDLHVAGISSPAAARILGEDLLQKFAAGSSLFMDRGKGWFTDLTGEAGPFSAGWASGGGFVDLDNDGWDDLFTVNGFVSGTGAEDTGSMLWRHVAASSAGTEEAGSPEIRSDLMSGIFSSGLSLEGHQRDTLYLARGDGTYRDISGVSGADSATDGRGALFADLDNDGDMDIVTTTAQRTARMLYRNNLDPDGGFVRITLEGTRSGKDAFGAVVRLKTSRGVQTRIKSGGSGFVSVHDPRLLFGLGGDEAAEWLEVTWPSGLKQRAGPIQAGDSLKIVEESEATRRIAESRFRLADPLNASQRAFRSLRLERGRELPAFPVLDAGGESLDLKEAVEGGRRALIHFWATWSAPCRREMKDLQALHEALREAGVDLLGVSLDAGQPGKVGSYLDELGIGYPVFIAREEEALSRLVKDDGMGIPFTLLVDGKGAVVEVFRGGSPRIRSFLEQVAGGL